MERLPTNYNSIKDLSYIGADDILAVELNAALLNLDECFDLLFIEKEHLAERELDILTRVHTRGKKKAIADATSILFQRMRDRNGSGACIEFLQNCGKFSIDAESNGTNSTGGHSGFNFNVYMDEDKKDKKEATDKTSSIDGTPNPLAEAS